MKMDENGVFLLNHGDSTPPDSAAPRGSGLEITIGEARTFKWLCSIANCWFTRGFPAHSPKKYGEIHQEKWWRLGWIDGI